MSLTPRIAAYKLDRLLRVRLKHVSGSVRVSSGGTSECRVTLSSTTAAGQRLVDSSDITFNANSPVAELDIQVGREKFSGKNAQVNILWGAFKRPGRESVDVNIEVPAGTALDVKTISGDVECSSAEIAQLDFSSVSGDLKCAALHGSAQLKTVSGRLSCGPIQGSLQAKTTSGSVQTEAVHGSIDIATVSGSVSSCIAIPADVQTKTVSGDIVISIVPDLAVAVDARSISGKLRSTIALDSDPQPEARSFLGGAIQWQASFEPRELPTASDEVVSISAKSVSGDILIQTLTNA